MNFYNQIIDKKGLKRILSWFIENYGPTRTSQLIEELKYLGFHSATQAGLSLGFDDLRIPPGKSLLLKAAQKQAIQCENSYLGGKITAFERYQKLIDIWTTTSENLKEEVVQNFQKTPLNPLYMMAFSGARGNISQVRQLVGMRGLMSDSGGGIIDFPIRSNFREGLSVTEYVISCYGARKGLIDTALRTADSGYLTRRLVDVAHALIISEIDCGTEDSISVPATEKHLVGRVLAQSLNLSVKNQPEFQETAPRSDRNSFFFQMKRNQDISPESAREIVQALSLMSDSDSLARHQNIQVRSPLTCAARNLCQLCYGWNLAQGRFVSIGDSVGILAAQSIGEPGTQLTMRTFHTGGIFSTDVEDKIFAPQDGIISFQNFPLGCKVRSIHGQTGFFSCQPLRIRIHNLGLHGDSREDQGESPMESPLSSILQLPAQSLIFVYPGKYVRKNDLCAEISRIFPSKAESQDIEERGKKLPIENPKTESKLQSRKLGKQSSNEISDESQQKSFDLDNAAFQPVLSEIQGQLTISGGGPPENQGDLDSKTQSPHEVWVLAGKRLVQSSRNADSKVPGKFRNISDPPLSSSPVGYLGDLFYFQGRRRDEGAGTRERAQKDFVSSAFHQKQHGVLFKSSRLSPSLGSNYKEGIPPQKSTQNAFEIRDSQGFVLPLNAQKCLQVKTRSELHLASLALPLAGEKKYCLGDLVRRHENPYHTEYSGQILRKRISRFSFPFTKSDGKFERKQTPGKGFPFPEENKSLESKTFFILRRVQPHLLSGFKTNFGSTNLRPLGSIVQERDVLFQLLLPLQQSKTGDIVQGLPKIEQLFEGRGRDIESLGLQQSGRAENTRYSKKTPSPVLKELQQRLISEIQSVYQSQGVEIGDKHVEIIVRQMTSKVRILEQGKTSFFPDDIVDLHYVREANLPESFYEPIILGITKVAFFTESFISAASFQETKRVLMSSALQNRVDFLEGLKENVIVGRLIPAGTGY